MNKSEMKAIKIHCSENDLTEDQVEYIRTNHCSTGRKIPITNHLRVCSALGIVAKEKHFLFHLSHPMTSLIIDEMNKQFEPRDFDDIDQNAVRIWLGEDSQFNPGLFFVKDVFRVKTNRISR